MKKQKLVIAISCAAALSGAPLLAQSSTNSPATGNTGAANSNRAGQPEQQADQPRASQVSASQLQGKKVKDSAGNDIGTIRSVKQNASGNQIQHVILSREGKPASETVAIPWRNFAMGANDTVMFTGDADRLENAPRHNAQDAENFQESDSYWQTNAGAANASANRPNTDRNMATQPAVNRNPGVEEPTGEGSGTRGTSKTDAEKD